MGQTVLPIQTAVESLTRSAEATSPDGRLTGRLAALRTLLNEDVAWVEAALQEVVDRGTAPGRDAARHLVCRAGKRVRPMALLLSAACFGRVGSVARDMALVAELIHSATLLHDDVIDDGMERRGAVAARRVWGNAISVLAGDLLLVEALERTQRSAPEVLASLVLTLRALVDGEIVQLGGRRTLDVSRDTYERVLKCKTASLFRWATSTGALVAGARTEDQHRLGAFGELVGMAFQLVDDALDYANDHSDKTSFADLREGKVTLPLVLAVAERPMLMEAVRCIHRGDLAPVAEVRKAVVDSGACEETRALAEEYTARAVGVLREIEPSDARSLLEAIALQLVARRG